MATWKDGAAYAPLERPDGFATPKADPLPEAAPYQAGTAGPEAAPDSITGAPDQRPLSDLGTETPPTRDPRDAFAVASLAMAAGPASTGARDPRQPFMTSATRAAAPSPSLAPPTGPPLAPLTTAPLATPVVSSPAPAPGTAPAPTAYPSNLPQHIGQYGGPGVQPRPGQSAPQRPQPGSQAAAEQAAQRRLAQLAGGLSFAGFLLSFAAPFLLIAAGGLAQRTKPLTGRMGTFALGTGVALLVFESMSGALGDTNWLASVAGLGFAIAFFIGAMRNS